MYTKEIFWIIVWFVALAAFIVSLAVPIPLPFSWYIFLGSSVAVVLLTVPCVYWGLAPLNICFTFVPEGTAKIVVSGGAAVATLIQYRNYMLDPKTGDVLPVFDEKTGEAISGRREEEHLFGGLRFYGFWPFCDIHTYRFGWSSADKDGELKAHLPEVLDYIGLFDDIYLFREVEAEDSELVPLNVLALLRIRITNPRKALFVAQDWLEMAINLVEPFLRKEITDSTYKELIRDRESLGEKAYKGAEALREELERVYGVKVLGLEVRKIDPPELLRDLTLKEVTARREAEVTAIRAAAEEDRITTVYNALAKAGPLGERVRLFEALEKSSGEGGSKLVFVPPGLLSGLSDLFRNTPSSVA